MQINSSMSILQNSYLYQSNNAVNSTQNIESKQNLFNQDSNMQDSTKCRRVTKHTKFGIAKGIFIRGKSSQW